MGSACKRPKKAKWLFVVILLALCAQTMAKQAIHVCNHNNNNRKCRMNYDEQVQYHLLEIVMRGASFTAAAACLVCFYAFEHESFFAFIRIFSRGNYPCARYRDGEMWEATKNGKRASEQQSK